MKHIKIITISILISSIIQSSGVFAWTLEEKNNAIIKQYNWSTLNLINDKAWTKITETKVLRKTWWDTDNFISWDAKEIYWNNDWTVDSSTKQDVSNEWTVWEYNNQDSTDLPIIFKPLNLDMVKKRVEDNYKQYISDMLQQEYDRQKNKMYRYTWYEMIKLSTITIPWVMGIKKKNWVSEQGSVIETVSSWENWCWVWYIYKLKKCVPNPNAVPNNYSSTDKCKTWYSMVNWKCVVSNQNQASSVYNNNKIKDWVTTIWIVIDKPMQSIAPAIKDVSSINMDFTNITIPQFDINPITCPWWYSDINRWPVCPTLNINFMNRFKLK